MTILLLTIQDNFAAIACLGLLATLGMGISQVFAIKAQTELYLQFKKKFPAILRMFKDKIGKFF
jgi:hypothetical protein